MKRLSVILIPMLFAACSLIDDDLSVCGEDVWIDYQLQLHTELSVQLQTELSAESDAPIREALERWLAPVFTDKAKDIDLRFFGAEKDEIKHQIQDEINDNRTSYTIYLPKENFMHLAVANIADNRQVQLSGDAHSETMTLSLPDERITPLTTGVFTARLPMEVTDSTTHFDVRLYMVTSAVALILDCESCPDLVTLEGAMYGGAECFALRDSVFGFDHPRTAEMARIPLNPNNMNGRHMPTDLQAGTYCLGTVSLPTEDGHSWSLGVTATLTDNRHTTTTLTVEEPLKAGTLRIIRCAMNAKGELNPDEEESQEIGASVTLDWKEGTDMEIEI